MISLSPPASYLPECCIVLSSFDRIRLDPLQLSSTPLLLKCHAELTGTATRVHQSHPPTHSLPQSSMKGECIKCIACSGQCECVSRTRLGKVGIEFEFNCECDSVAPNLTQSNSTAKVKVKVRQFGLKTNLRPTTIFKTHLI